VHGVALLCYCSLVEWNYYSISHAMTQVLLHGSNNCHGDLAEHLLKQRINSCAALSPLIGGVYIACNATHPELSHPPT
jgi:hypothetical protein